VVFRWWVELVEGVEKARDGVGKGAREKRRGKGREDKSKRYINIADSSEVRSGEAQSPRSPLAPRVSGFAD